MLHALIIFSRKTNISKMDDEVINQDLIFTLWGRVAFLSWFNMIVTEAGFIAQGVLANMLHFRVASTVVRTQHSNDKVQFIGFYRNLLHGLPTSMNFISRLWLTILSINAISLRARWHSKSHGAIYRVATGWEKMPKSWQNVSYMYNLLLPLFQCTFSFFCI